MSARKPIDLPLPKDPSIVPTTPVLPRPRWVLMPHASSCLAMTSAVRFS